ncbi:MAG: putative RDD family membrane protein YckC [Ascidiaceihabitans sp.]|jgi:uncharacterized RDD family membrane protein YckC
MKDRRIEIVPPEGVPVSLVVATGGSRLGAQSLDILITFGGMFLFLLFIIYANLVDDGLLSSLFFLLVFFLRVPYYIFSELVWNGRTLGKRIVKIRVISADGGRLTPHQIVARNLMKEVEVFLPATTLLTGSFGSGWTGFAIFIWMCAILLFPLMNKRRLRLGDMIAGTLVVEQPKAQLLPDLAAQKVKTQIGFVFDVSHLNIYGRYELQALESILRERPTTPEASQRVSDVVRTIRRKINYVEQLLPNDHWVFLTDFYRQQREYLESRQLFGDARENKFHDTPKT